MSIVGEVVLSLMVMMMVMMKEKYKYFEIILQSDCLRYIVELCYSWIAKEKETATRIERGPQEKKTNIIHKDCKKLLSVGSHRYF